MSPENEERRGTRPVSDELRPYVDDDEIGPIDETAALIREGRAIPRPEFRSELRAGLAGLERSGSFERRPRRLKATIAACAGSGIALLAVAGLGVAGTGPLGF